MNRFSASRFDLRSTLLAIKSLHFLSLTCSSSLLIMPFTSLMYLPPTPWTASMPASALALISGTDDLSAAIPRVAKAEAWLAALPTYGPI